MLNFNGRLVVIHRRQSLLPLVAAGGVLSASHVVLPVQCARPHFASDAFCRRHMRDRIVFLCRLMMREDDNKFDPPPSPPDPTRPARPPLWKSANFSQKFVTTLFLFEPLLRFFRPICCRAFCLGFANGRSEKGPGWPWLQTAVRVALPLIY